MAASETSVHQPAIACAVLYVTDSDGALRCRNVIDALAQCFHSVIAAADAGTDASLAAAGPGFARPGPSFVFSFRHSHACTWLRFIWHRLHNSAWKGRHACSSATSSNHGPDRPLNKAPQQTRNFQYP